MSFGFTNLITVARDRVSDSEDCYILVVLFSFFRPPIFRRPWADFRETLPHDAICPEIVLSVHTCPLKNLSGEKLQFLLVFGPKIDTLSPAIP